MSKFLYPRDLYRSLSKVWDASPFTTGWPTVELPEQKILNHLLDVCYHASFLVEESRPVTFRAVFIEQTTPIKPLEADHSHPTELYMFDAPVPFTAEELRQVAPAADLTSVLIAIQCTDKGSGALGIVGLVDTLVSGKSGDFPLGKAVGGECDEALPTPMPLYTLG
jgi:hypothetical protein